LDWSIINHYDNQLSKLYSKKSENRTYPVILGQQYTAKFSAPVCKVNLFFYGTKQIQFLKSLVIWLSSFNPIPNPSWTLTPIYIALHNHISSRSVFCTSTTSYMLLFKKEENEMLDAFHEFSLHLMYVSHFWMLTPIYH